MLRFLIEYSVRQRLVIYALTLVLIVLGGWCAWRLPLDAVPDITSPQVQINTLVPALAPEEIEQQVTFPLENEMGGLPGLHEFRSLSKFGLSQVTMIFEDGVDLYRVRQLVAERIQSAMERLPRGLTPKMAPIATGLGEIFYYAVDYRSDAPGRPETRSAQLMELRALHDTLIRPLLRQTPGVAEVNASGGYEKQIVVRPHPEKMRLAGMTLESLAGRLRENLRNAGGGLVEIGGEQAVIRSATRIESQARIADLSLRPGTSAAPLRLGEVADVEIGSSFRTGASTRQGEEALLGAAIMLAGENSRVVAGAVRAKLASLQAKLPKGVEIRPLYDRGELVDATLRTVEKNLAEGALLVVATLFLFLGNLRAAFIVALSIPLSMCFAFVGMAHLGLAGNLMSLGAIDFGLIVDGSVVMAENIVRHLGERQKRLGRALHFEERVEEVMASAKEVAGPMFAGVLIITLVYVPILALGGIEGKMFKPMAAVVMLALGGALVLALTLVPALCAGWLGKGSAESESRTVRIAQAIYAPSLRWVRKARWVAPVGMVGLFALAAAIWSRMGRDFVPQLNEGSFAMHMIRGSSVGLGASLEMQQRSERLLLEWFPEIREIFSRLGTAEIATDPMGPNVADTYILLHPQEQWRREAGRPISKEKLGRLMEELLLQKAPGQTYEMTQPIQMRFNEIMAGARADLLCKIYGDDYEVLERLAGEVRSVLLTIPGHGDPPLEGVGRTPLVEVRPRLEALRKHGLHGEDINRVVETALAGEEAGVWMEGNRRVPIVVRVAESWREDPRRFMSLPIEAESGGLLTLGQVAVTTNLMAVNTIVRENSRRRVAILLNLVGRDTVGFVEEAQRALRERVPLPPGYFIEFGGQFQHYLEAKRRLAVLVPASLALIVVMIFLTFRSMRQTALICAGLPLAASGGVLALWMRGLPFTISAAVGFIALGGIAVLNGIMLVSYINQLRREGMELAEAVTLGTLTRLRPKLMTALVASLGFVPMALSTGPGSEVQRPLATVVIGGIVTSSVLTLLVLPVLYEWIERKRQM
ncbi:MAG: efflux RND transporter permease subunit [Verrucomicrobia bacterium]|nr:efflux RND transporter permease subunit [Verrucomicrobiota bacterium]